MCSPATGTAAGRRRPTTTACSSCARSDLPTLSLARVDDADAHAGELVAEAVGGGIVARGPGLLAPREQLVRPLGQPGGGRLLRSAAAEVQAQHPVPVEQQRGPGARRQV